MSPVSTNIPEWFPGLKIHIVVPLDNIPKTFSFILVHKTTTYDVRNSNFRITPNLNVIQLCTWETWKITVTDAANESIGKSKPVKEIIEILG
jgi:hypothetical protein